MLIWKVRWCTVGSSYMYYWLYLTKAHFMVYIIFALLLFINIYILFLYFFISFVHFYFLVDFGGLLRFWANKKSKMVDARWSPYWNRNVITASYDAIVSCCGPQRKHLWATICRSRRIVINFYTCQMYWGSCAFPFRKLAPDDSAKPENMKIGASY